MPAPLPKSTEYVTDRHQGRPSAAGNSREIISVADDEDAPHLPPGTRLMGFPRSECEGGPRPCPLVGCPYNNYLEVSPATGHIKINYSDRLPEDVPPEQSCCLDVADTGGKTLEEVGEILGLTRERIRQIEISALQKIRLALGDDWLEQVMEK